MTPLDAVLAEFAASDRDVPYWQAMPDMEEPWGTNDCGWLSVRFARCCIERGLDAFVLGYPAAHDAPDSMQGDHVCAGIDIDGVVWVVDWTARQFYDLTDDQLDCPRIWTGEDYEPLTGVKFDSPKRFAVEAMATRLRKFLLA